MLNIELPLEIAIVRQRSLWHTIPFPNHIVDITLCLNEAILKTSLRFFSFVSAFVLLLSTLSAFGQTRLVISQMYGGGGNTGAPFTLRLPRALQSRPAHPIDLTGYSIQYVSATGTAWNAVALPSATVAPGHYYLIQAAAGTTVTGINLPVTPDFITGNGSTGNRAQLLRHRRQDRHRQQHHPSDDSLPPRFHRRRLHRLRSHRELL